MRRWILLWLLLLTVPALAQDPSPSPSPAPPPPVEPKEYSQLWVDKTCVVTPEAVAATVAGVKKQNAKPEHIIVFIHGFDVSRDSSTAEFDALALRLRKHLEPTRASVAYAGVQWESASDQSIFELANVYWEKISVARSTGRGPTRELLFALAKAFPKSRITLMAHSMGCEVAAAAIIPEVDYADQVPFVPTCQPETDVKLQMAVLCGSDVDYDMWAKSHAVARNQNERCKLMWHTVAPYLGKGDNVLDTRAKMRGKAAGSAFPKMTLEQLDLTLAHRRAIFDGEDIPTDHKFSKYYNDARLARIVPVMLYIDNAKLPKPPEIAEIDDILNAPDDLPSLLPYLDNGHYGTLYYTLWRLERMNCGDARHLTDGTLEEIGRMLKGKPQQIWRKAPTSECKTVKEGQFPSEKMMTKAGAPPWAKKK